LPAAAGDADRHVEQQEAVPGVGRRHRRPGRAGLLRLYQFSPAARCEPAGGPGQCRARAGRRGAGAADTDRKRPRSGEPNWRSTRARSVRCVRNESVVLRPEIAGRIATINFRDGVAVSKGQLLLTLDAAMQAAELDQARANLGLAQANFTSGPRSFSPGSSSASRRLTTRRRRSRCRKRRWRWRRPGFDKTRIRAPFSGIVGIRNVSVGDYVKEGQELVNIEDIGTLKIDFRLPESYLAQLKPGQQLQVSSDALPGKLFTAVLDAINPLVEAGGRAIALRASLPNGEGRLRPGMFVRVRLIFRAAQQRVADP
jgi:membrane fusion protein (multidrug efflux system)